MREFYEEYLYDDNGSIAFIYAKHPYLSFGENDEDMDYEFRFYFNKGKLINAIVKKSALGKGEYKEDYSEKSPSRDISRLPEQIAGIHEDVQRRRPRVVQLLRNLTSNLFDSSRQVVVMLTFGDHFDGISISMSYMPQRVGIDIQPVEGFA